MAFGFWLLAFGSLLASLQLRVRGGLSSRSSSLVFAALCSLCFTARAEGQEVKLTPEEVRKQMRPSTGIEPEPAGFSGVVVTLIAAGAGLAGLAAGFLLGSRYRKTRTMDGAAMVQAKGPAGEALLQIDRIEGLNLAARGEWATYSTELANVVRTYLEKRFQLAATKRTSAEVLADSKTADLLSSGQRALVQGFLNESDRIRFGRVVPTLEQGRKLASLARQIIGQTA
jgi:hypothetical protein